jgi:hypothetical protein
MNIEQQNKIEDEVHNIIDGLILANFFKDFEIDDISFAENHVKEFLIKKYEQGYDITNTNDDLFNDDEFDDMLQNIIAGSTISELKSNGMIDHSINFKTIDGKIQIKDN